MDWYWFIGLEHVCVTRGRKLFLLKFSLRDDDDEFLYGDSQLKITTDVAVAPPVPVPSSAGENNSSLLLAACIHPATRFVFYSSSNINPTYSPFPCVRVSLRLSVSVT